MLKIFPLVMFVFAASTFAQDDFSKYNRFISKEGITIEKAQDGRLHAKVTLEAKRGMRKYISNEHKDSIYGPDYNLEIKKKDGKILRITEISTVKTGGNSRADASYNTHSTSFDSEGAFLTRTECSIIDKKELCYTVTKDLCLAAKERGIKTIYGEGLFKESDFVQIERDNIANMTSTEMKFTPAYSLSMDTDLLSNSEEHESCLLNVTRLCVENEPYFSEEKPEPRNPIKKIVNKVKGEVRKIFSN